MRILIIDIHFRGQIVSIGNRYIVLSCLELQNNSDRVVKICGPLSLVLIVIAGHCT
jgi:hypothetical protein